MTPHPISCLRRLILIRAAVMLVQFSLIFGVAACGESGTTAPESLRYAQVGSMELVIRSPIALGAGMLEQRLTWRSDGAWALDERISYGAMLGDEHENRTSPPTPITAGHYAQWITQVNDNPGLSLFVSQLDPDLQPECRVPSSALELTLTDETSRTRRSWSRCTTGFLSDLTPVGAGPDPAAARVANAATLARDFTIGSAFRSAFAGTLPFGTLLKGESRTAVIARAAVITSADGFSSLWSELNPGQPQPTIDFDEQTVILAAVGERIEAGDSVEVRRVLPVARGTVIELVERIPGNFCSPAERRHYPYHLVVTPRLEAPVRFTSPIDIERVPCG